MKTVSFVIVLAAAVISAHAVQAQQEGAVPFPNITVTWDSMPIADVVNVFAEFTDRTIVVDTTIAEWVTVEIRNRPWREVFNAILDAHCLTAIEDGAGNLRVVRRTSAPSADSILRTELMCQ